MTDKPKIALVTGGTGGIGAAICLKLADSGFRVLTNYRNEAKAQAWKAEVGAKGYDIGIYQSDASDYGQCEALVKQIEQDYGVVEVLVNNAGITRDTTLRKMTLEQWNEVIHVNLDSVFNMSRQVVNGMLDKGWGRIVNISSINGQKGQLGQANYSASKRGMHGFTMALAQEVARKGITVNTVSPGYIATEMVMAVPEKIRDAIIADIPVGRLGTVEEVAGIVDFLTSDSAAFITGADIAVNGGQLMF
ncbi:MAG: acetoacetyl-CoA reductase [Methylococcaceae bacterium]|nr:acetoacetyl-CoA reductase [Methylococcaceae bacterium]